MKLDIGAGPTAEDGWRSWDIKDGGDARRIDLPDGSVDEIRACHVLEHLGLADTLPTLKEWHRVLRSGGRLYVAVPDFERIATAFLARFPDLNLERYVVGGQTDEHDFHRTIWWSGKLEAALKLAGFERVAEVGAEGPNTSRHYISLNMEAFKP